MNQKISKIIEFVCASLLILLVALLTPAHAYVDPGSGSVIVTTVLGMIAAVGYTFRKFFYNLRAKIYGKKNEPNSQDDRSLDG